MTVPLCWAVFILFMHGIPGSELIYKDPWRLFRFDKMAHMALFAIFVVTLNIGFRKQSHFRRPRIHARKFSVVVAIVYGGLLEFSQSHLFEKRCTDPIDFLADMIGAFGGLILFRLIYGKELLRSF